MRSVLSAVIAYVGSRLLFVLVSFEYDLFSDPFHVGKFAIDLCVFAGCYLIAYWLLGQLKYFKK